MIRYLLLFNLLLVHLPAGAAGEPTNASTPHFSAQITDIGDPRRFEGYISTGEKFKGQFRDDWMYYIDHSEQDAWVVGFDRRGRAYLKHLPTDQETTIYNVSPHPIDLLSKSDSDCVGGIGQMEQCKRRTLSLWRHELIRLSDVLQSQGEFDLVCSFFEFNKAFEESTFERSRLFRGSNAELTALGLLIDQSRQSAMGMQSLIESLEIEYSSGKPQQDCNLESE